MLNPKTEEAYKLLHNGILALARAEQQGIRVDLEYVEGKKAELTKRIDELEQQFKATKFYTHWEHTVKGKVNINSNAQLSHFLYNVKKLTTDRLTESGQGATDEEALQQLNIPELNQLLEVRKLRKMRDTYLDSFVREQVKGVVRPFFNLHIARTYRSSSDHPNFQNIPKRDEEAMQTVRRAMFPRVGHQFVEVDYSSLEVRIAACYHKDNTMLKYINDAKSDMHTDMAKQIYMLAAFDKAKHNVLRQSVKNGFVFPQFYGDYYKNCAIYMACEWCKLPQGRWKPTDGIKHENSTIAAHLISKGIKSLDDFTEHIRVIEQDFWENRFPEYAAWKERWWTVYKKYGYVDMFTGFRCSGVMSRNDCTNYPVQGAAFHCLLWSFIELDRIMQVEQWQTHLVGQIHDSILLDVHPDELEHVKEVVKRVTCIDLPKAWPWIIVPLDVDIAVSKINASWVG